MSLAFSHDEMISTPASIRRPTRKATARKATSDLVFILAFVAFAIASILVVATHASSPDTESAIAAFAEL